MTDMSEVKTLIDGINKDFVAFKSENDAKLAEILKKGSADVVLVEKVERIAKAVADAESIKGRLERAETALAKVTLTGLPQGKNAELDEAKSAFEAFVRKGDPAPMSAFVKKNIAAAGVNADGGFLVPTIIDREIYRLVLEISDVRGLVTSRRAPVGYKKNVNKRGFASGWVGETGTRSTTNVSTYAQVGFTSGELYAAPQIYRFLLDDADTDVLSDIMQDAAEEIAYQEGVAVMTGNGTNKPTGLLTGTPVATDDASRAFGTLQYVATTAAANFAASNPADQLIAAQYKLKAHYRKRAKWACNKNTLGTIMQFKDGQGNYLYKPATLAGVPSTLNGYELAELEAMPAIAANAFPLAFGDFKSAYYLLDIGSTSVIRDEVSSRGSVIYYFHKRLGGNIVDSEAVKLIKCAVS